MKNLRDQLPLAGDEEIKVSLDDPSIKPDEFGTGGRIAWKTPMARAKETPKPSSAGYSPSPEQPAKATGKKIKCRRLSGL